VSVSISKLSNSGFENYTNSLDIPKIKEQNFID